MHAIELVEDALEIGRRDARTFIDDLDLDEFAVAARANVDPAAGGRIFGRVVEQVEQDLLEQHGVEAQHRQLRLDRDLDTVPGQHVPRPLQVPRRRSR